LGNQPEAIIVGDFNNDGKLVLEVADSGDAPGAQAFFVGGEAPKTFKAFSKVP
jgi:hypothetical protein